MRLGIIYVGGNPDEILDEVDIRIETTLTQSFSFPNNLDTSYVIPHLYFLDRYTTEQWAGKTESCRHLFAAVRKMPDTHKGLSPAELNSVRYFFERTNLYDYLPQSLVPLLKKGKTGGTVTNCLVPEQLGALSGQAVLYHQKIKTGFTKEALLEYIRHTAQNISPDDLTLNGLIGIGWGALHEIFLFEE